MGYGLKLWAATIVAAGLVSQASAASLFVDEFDMDPDANGWTEFIDQNSDTTNLADIAPTGGGEVIFATDYNGSTGADTETFRITRTLNGAGYRYLAMRLSVREDTGVESVDVLRVQVDTGSGFSTVASVNGEFGTTTLGPTFLGPDADNASFDLRIEAVNNAEDFYLDRLDVYELYGSALYEDGFSLDAAASGTTGRAGFTDGWTVEQGDVGNGFTADSDGDEVVLSRSTVDTSPDANDYIQLTHAFDTTGYYGIHVELDARQSNTVFESEDSLAIQYSVDGGSNFTDLLVDPAIWNANGNSTAGTGNTAGAIYGPARIHDPLVNDNADFMIRIVGAFNADVEEYLLNNFTIWATPIPTPASLPAGLGLMGLLAIRRRGRSC